MDDGDMDVDMEGGMGEETSSRQASATSRTMSRQSNRPGELHIIDEARVNSVTMILESRE